jgi:hypothetical protein
MPPFRSVVLFPALLALLFAGPAHADAGVGDWWQVAHRLAPAGSAIDFTPHGTQPGLNYQLLSSETCATCHGADSYPPGNTSATFRPYATWGGTMMANATRDPVFFAALDVANHDVPGVGDYCLRCHTSSGWYGGHVVKAGFGDPDNNVTLGAAGCLLGGAYDWQDTVDSDYGGISCHYCHRLLPTGPNGEPQIIGNGDAWVDDQPCVGAGEPCRHGPYDDTDDPPPHPWAYSEFHTESAICGTCHDVTTPDTSVGPLKTLLLANGTDTGLPFPIERTYSEWLQSDYSNTANPDAQTCQGCHMPSSEDPTATACALGGYPNRTGNLPVHAFVGGNTWIPGIIEGQYSDTTDIPGAYGGVGRQASFEQTIAWARQMLGNAASLATSIASYTPPTATSAGAMNVAVTVTNLSGHKLPTGYSEGRRMWLNLEVHDANGALVFESGAYDAAAGVLTKDAQVRVYEVLQGLWNRNGDNACDVVDALQRPIFHFALSDCIAKDNRIPPLGFTPATATDPNGYLVGPVPAGIYPQAAPGVLVNYDTPSYSVTIPAGTPLPLTATARLYYQTSSNDYIEFLRNEAAENAFQGENLMCGAQQNRPFVVGPQDLTRGEYMYRLWNGDITRDSRIFGDGFDGNPLPAAYGKSPPELMQVASATTP